MTDIQYVQAHQLSCSFEQANQTLFSDISLTTGTGLHCLVGRNGSGKSHLVKQLAKQVPIQTGKVIHFGDIGYLGQTNGQSTDYSSIDAILAAQRRINEGQINSADFELMENQWDILARLEKALKHFQLPHNALELPDQTLSGGEQVRLSLAKLATAQFNFVILDEPGNHLDSIGKKLLINWLKTLPGSLVVTHDRAILEQADVIYELEHGQLFRVQGNYSTWQQHREQRLQTFAHQEMLAKQSLRQEQRKKQQLVERQATQAKRGAISRANANQSKMVLDKAKESSQTTHAAKTRAADFALQKAQEHWTSIHEQKTHTDALQFDLAPPKKVNGPVVQARQLKLPFGTKASIDIQLHPGDKLAITGMNGAGKSTLLKVLQQELTPEQGAVDITRSCRYVDQHFSFLSPTLSALENIQRCIPNHSETQYRTALAHVRLRREKALQPVETLSGGEKLKVALVCLFYGEQSPALLLLDEPDNHLDLESKELLEKTLKAWPGSLIAISHDPAFITNCGITESLHLQQ